jgi:eukaryotic-like serine/threonine-protein kinase
VAWIGAGLSAELGIPLWSDLRKMLEDAAEEKFRSIPSSERPPAMAKLLAVRGLADHWLAFERLESLLGETTFVGTVRKAMRPKNDLAGECYEQLWSLRLDGVLNLNLDGLATKAFHRTRNDREAQLVEFQGKNCGPFIHVLKGDSPFLVNLHGIADDRSSWVFSRNELKELQSSPAYKTLIHSIFATRTVLFLGIRADDLASGGLLAEIRAAGTDPGSHFWMTERGDSATDAWAEKSGIQVIRYEAPNGDHSELTRMLSDLRSYLPVDPPEKPVAPIPAQSNWKDIQA